MATNQNETAMCHEYKDDLLMASRNLQTFQNRLKVDVLVPLGSHALMPGYLYHTNEVLIGKPSGIFIEATTSQALDIVNRRINVANQRLKDLEVESGFFSSKLDYSRDVFSHEDQKEIIEEYDEEAEKQWRVEHRLKVREAKVKEREQRHNNVPDEDFNALMENLDELEMMEELEEEFNEIIVPDPVDISGQVAFKEKPRTSYQLESYSSAPVDREEQECDPTELSVDLSVEESAKTTAEPIKKESKRKSLQFSEDLEKVKLIHKMDRPNSLITRYDPEKTLQLTFKHSPLEFHPPRVASETIGSPGDIYNTFEHCLKHWAATPATPEDQPKSILKKTNHVIHVNKSAKLISFEDGDQETAPVGNTNIYQQVVGDVLERNSSQSQSRNNGSTNIVQGDTKRVSRFKAARS